MPVGTSSENGGTPQPLTLGSEGSKDFRQMCKYGKGCYQKNPMHHQKFKHPKDEESPAKGKIDTEIKEPTPKKAKLDLSPEKNVEKSELKEEKSVENEKKLEEEEVEKTEEKVEKTEEKVEEDFELIPEFDKWPLDPLESIQQKFLTKMPEDFMAFWDFCKGLNREDPSKALFDTCGLLLVGPFDILSQKTFKSCKLQDFLCHYRYYRDPPEFQTVLASADENSNFHIGYFRDDPKENPAFVAAFGGQKDSAEFSNYKLTLLGDNLFSALFLHIGVLINKVDPFKMTALQKLKGAVHLHAQMKNQDQSFTLEAKTTSMKCRDKQKVSILFIILGMIIYWEALKMLCLAIFDIFSIFFYIIISTGCNNISWSWTCGSLQQTDSSWLQRNS